MQNYSDAKQMCKCIDQLLSIDVVLLMLVELLTITVVTFFCFVDVGGIVDYHCSNFALLMLVELLTITVLTFFCFVDVGGIVDHHCCNFLLFC